MQLCALFLKILLFKMNISLSNYTEIKRFWFQVGRGPFSSPHFEQARQSTPRGVHCSCGWAEGSTKLHDI